MTEIIQPGMPTVTDADRMAARVREAIEAAAALIPRLEAPHPSTARRVRAYRTISREFIESTIAAIEAIEGLQQAANFDLDEARSTLQFIEAFRPIADQLVALLASLTYTMEARKSAVADAALRAYAITRGLARDADSATAAAHAAILKRDLRRRRGNVTPSAATAPPDSSPASPLREGAPSPD